MPSLKSYPNTVDFKAFHELGQSFCSSYLPISQMQKNPFSFSIIISPPYDICCAGYSAQFLMFSLTKCNLPAAINGKHTGTLGFVPIYISGLDCF